MSENERHPASPGAPTPASAPRNRGIIMASVMVSMAFGPFLGSSINLCIPSMALAFNVDAATIGWTATLYMIAMAALSVPMGKIADMTSHRSMFLLGLALIVAGSVLCGFAPNFLVLLIVRGVQALGAAMLNASSIPIAVGLYPPQQRGRTLGKCIACVYVGGSLGPAFGGLVVWLATWQWVFFVTAMIAVVSLLLALKGLPREKATASTSQTGAAPTRRRLSDVDIDGRGNVLFLFSITLFMVGLTGLTSMPFAWAIMLAGLALGVLFVLHTRRVTEPVIRLTMFTKDRVFTLSNLAALLNFLAVSALTYVMSLYFQTVLGWPALAAGLLLLVQPVVQAIVAPLSGTLSDRIAPWKISTLGMACSGVALACLAFLQMDTPLLVIIVVLVVAGFGFGIFSTPNTNAIMGRVPPSEFGSANAIVSTMRTIGQAASMSVVTIVMGQMLGTLTLEQASAAQLLDTMHVCFIVFASICVVGVVCSMARGGSKGGAGAVGAGAPSDEDAPSEDGAPNAAAAESSAVDETVEPSPTPDAAAANVAADEAGAK